MTTYEIRQAGDHWQVITNDEVVATFKTRGAALYAAQEAAHANRPSRLVVNRGESSIGTGAQHSADRA